MKPFVALCMAVCLAFISCKKTKTEVTEPPAATVMLKDVVVQSLPDPYYHFEYDGNGKVSKASFSSNMAVYEVRYENSRVSQLQKVGLSNRDRIMYKYDEQGRVEMLTIINSGGTIYRRCFLAYDGQGRLAQMEWELKEDPSFIADRTLTFSYHNDGNLAELRQQLHAMDGRQTPAVYTDRFEAYDNGVNVDGFALLHVAGQHLVLLPGVQLQRNNPVRNVRSGDGVNYDITYQYQYNNKHLPLQKTGEMLFTSGPNAGKRFTARTSFSYYD